MRNAIDPLLVGCPKADSHGGPRWSPYRGEAAYDPGCTSNNSNIVQVARRRSDNTVARTCSQRGVPEYHQAQPSRVDLSDDYNIPKMIDDRGGLYPREQGLRRFAQRANARTCTGARNADIDPYQEPSYMCDGSLPHHGSGQYREASSPQVVYEVREDRSFDQGDHHKGCQIDDHHFYGTPGACRISAGPVLEDASCGIWERLRVALVVPHIAWQMISRNSYRHNPTAKCVRH